MQPTSLDDLNHRALLAQRLAGMLCVAVALATAIRPLLAQLSPWMTAAGVVNALVLLVIYRLIHTGRLHDRAPTTLVFVCSLMLLGMLIATGGSDSQFAALIPITPLLAMMLGGSRMCLLCAGFWAGVVGLDLALPQLMQAVAPFPADINQLRTKSLWLIITIVVGTFFSLHVDHTLGQLKRTLQRQATADPLTGLLNRRGLDDGITWELARAARLQQPLAVLVADVDRFKQFNDGYGHDAGDKLLQQMARTLKSNVRAGQDLVSRFGGEEFVLVLTNTNADAAQTTAEKIRLAISQLSVAHGDASERVSITIGGATLEPPLASQTSVAQRQAQFEELLQRADQAMYQGKAAGRDQVVIAT